MKYPDTHNADMDMVDLEHILIPGEWRNSGEMQDLAAHLGRNRDNAEGKKVRDYMKNYFNSPVGSVPWQEKMVSAKYRVFWVKWLLLYNSDFKLLSLIVMYCKTLHL